MYSKSFDNKIWYSNADAEPFVIVKNRFKSGIDSRPQPLAIFVGIEEHERRIWETKLKSSSLGNFEVIL